MMALRPNVGQTGDAPHFASRLAELLHVDISDSFAYIPLLIFE